MKVLIIHNRYKISGGEDVSTEAEVTLLRKNGVNVDTFFVSNEEIGNRNKINLALNTVWSRKSYKEVLEKVRKEKYDIVHIQNFFPLLSPSIFYAARKAGSKVVMSVRNYRLVCPNASMFLNNNLCEACVGKKIPYDAILHKCYRDSYMATATTVAMLTVHNFLETWRNKIDGFICISNFVKEQLVKGGFSANQLHLKYNFVATELEPDFEPEDYYIYVGRLSSEKGIIDLINVFQKNGKKLIILGDGPFREEVLNVSQKYPNILFPGKTPLNQVYKLISKSKALIFPSKWHEPFGRTIVESFAHGTPVIGTALGGVTELIKEGYNGILYDPYLTGSLETAIEKFESLPVEKVMRENAYNSYLENFTPEKNFNSIITIYNNILSK